MLAKSGHYGVVILYLAIVLGGCSTIHYSPTLGLNSIVVPLRDEQGLKGLPRVSFAHKAEYSVSMGGSESFLETYGAVLYDQSFSLADTVSYSVGIEGGAYLVTAKDRSIPTWSFDQYSWGPSMGLRQGLAWSVDGLNYYLGTDLHYEKELGPLFEARGRLIHFLEKGTYEGQDSNKSPNGSTLAGYLVFSEGMRVSHSTALTTSAGLGVGFYDWPMHSWGDYLARCSLTYSLGKSWVSLGGDLVFPSRWGFGLGWGASL